MTAAVKVDIARLSAELEELAGFTDSPAPSVTRILFTATDRAAREFFKQCCRETGLLIREDAVGNIFGRWVGSDPQASAVGTGSHTDAIPNSGRYDGTVGVFGGLEAIRALRAAGHKPRRSIELLMFTAEEPTRYGIGCLGSRLLSGTLSPAAATALRDGSGTSLDEARAECGFRGDLATVALAAGYYETFVELHIEQGPLLEKEGLAIGIVEAIAAPASMRVVFHGQGGHAGTVMMPDRRDALLGAAELALAVDRAARATGSPSTVGTVGVMQPFPGAINSIPSRCTIEIDVRDTALEPRDAAVEEILSGARAIAERRGLTVGIQMLNADPPATCGTAVVEAVARASAQLGIPSRRMVSRAYHDSLFMARVCPTGMIFIPCRDGVSHRPDEYSSPEEIRRGVEVLALTLAELSG